MKNKNLWTQFILIFILFVMGENSFSQTTSQQEIDRQIKEIMKAREEMIKSLFNDSNFQNLDKHFEDLIQQFDKNANGFGMGDMPGSGDVLGEYDWRETDNQMVFVLKVKQIKNKPLDIKIQKGQIQFIGDIETVDLNNPKSKRVSKVHFERIFSIPEGVDQKTPEFENKNNELLIKFKKLKTSKTTPKAPPVKPVDQRLPVGKDENDITI